MAKRNAVERIEQALLELLKAQSLRDITVTDLCAAAKVSRSSFYAHFSNVDEVYRSLIRQMIFGANSLNTQLKSANNQESTLRRPLCSLLRDAEEYEGLVSDEAFMATFFDLNKTEFNEEALGIFQDAAMDAEAAFAIYIFQMAGCMTAARTLGEDADWSKVKAAIDTFIRGGLNAVRNAKKLSAQLE